MAASATCQKVPKSYEEIGIPQRCFNANGTIPLLPLRSKQIEQT